MKKKQYRFPKSWINAAAFGIGDKGSDSLLTVFLEDAGLCELGETERFISTVVNEGIENLPSDDQERLFLWSKRQAALMAGVVEERPEMSRRDFGRHLRYYVPLLGLPLAAGSVVYRATRTEDNNEQKANAIAANILAASGVIVGAGMATSFIAARLCEMVFEERLCAWLKEKYNMDLLPPRKEAPPFTNR